MKKFYSFLFLSACGLLLVALSLLAGCGQGTSSTTTTTIANAYTLQGQVIGVTVAGVRAAAVSTVTNIVAIGSNSQTYSASIDASGTFSVQVNAGYPCALGFYNKSGGAITLLGYLKQKDVSWESLPLMNPAGTSTDLGSVEVDTASVEAIPSLALNSLITQLNMTDNATAVYYGEIDGPMTVFTNLDVDGNGEFDYQEGKSYQFSIYVNMSDNTSSAGQIPLMLNGNYNTAYVPKPSGYSLVIAAQGDAQSTGTPLTFKFPATVSNSTGSTNSITVSVETTTSSDIWCAFSKLNNNLLTTPEVIPAGTYTVEVGAKVYTFKNFQGSEVVKVNSNDGIIYPIFNIVTNEAGYITRVNYQWKKLVNGTSTAATDSELKASIEDTSGATAFVHTSPFISFFSGPSTLIGSIIKIDRDASYIDLSSYSIKLSDVDHIQASYNLTSRVVCKFDLGW